MSESLKFPNHTKETLYKKSEQKCAYCGASISRYEDANENSGVKKASLHHIIPKWWASKNLKNTTEVRNYISSENNGDYLCDECHDRTHKETEEEFYKMLAANLLGKRNFKNEQRAEGYPKQRDWSDIPIEPSDDDIRRLEERIIASEEQTALAEARATIAKLTETGADELIQRRKDEGQQSKDEIRTVATKRSETTTSKNITGRIFEKINRHKVKQALFKLVRGWNGRR